ncbi:PAS domain-containing sensor histidine kinase [Geobacter sp.]|uniref:PAS domain-containing sensor histidine kinase n=1 Tax=Geobacter sp. TaxID=46610 RepID=UPI002608EAE4|nr:PAS domain-containing sensor histidine kinase [Geobacter sp.]
MNITSPETPKTYYASPRRAGMEEVSATHRRILSDATLQSLIDALPDYVLVLNRERQVVSANTRLLDAFGFNNIGQILAERSGEALGCIFSTVGPDGCGTSSHCSVCGTLLSILECQERKVQSCHECHLSLARDGGTSLDLEVTAAPATVDGIPLTVCILRDISDQKRRSILERVFFHDVVNTAGGIHGIASMLVENAELSPEKERQYKEWMVLLSNRLIDEINHQRKLLAAERGEFIPEVGIVDVPGLMREMHALYASHDIAAGRNLVLGTIVPALIESDGAILRRILGNLVKNALEASDRGETVTLSSMDDGDTITFAVHNAGEMPSEVQLQIFQRSFSTKSSTGRGIGTYSVRLFGERYLKGKVSFTSREPEGTTFRITIPKLFSQHDH